MKSVSRVLVKLAFSLELGLKAICIALAHIRVFWQCQAWPDQQHRGLQKPRIGVGGRAERLNSNQHTMG